MVLVVTYVLLSLFVAFVLLGVVARLTAEPRVARLSFLVAAAFAALSILGLLVDSL
jgi:hypothetical protein